MRQDGLEAQTSLQRMGPGNVSGIAARAWYHAKPTNTGSGSAAMTWRLSPEHLLLEKLCSAIWADGLQRCILCDGRLVWQAIYRT